MSSKRELVIQRRYEPNLERQIATLERLLAADLADALARVEFAPVGRRVVRGDQSPAKPPAGEEIEQHAQAD